MHETSGFSRSDVAWRDLVSADAHDPDVARRLNRPVIIAPDMAWRLVLILCTAKLVIYVLSSGPLHYGVMADEYYYLDCARHLAWGYVDHPPLYIAALAMVRATLGDSLLALRLLPALAGCATIAFVVGMARDLGGGRAAQGLAGLAALISPLYLAVAGFYSMNAFEPAFWALAAWLLLRALRDASSRAWLALGLVMGLGLLNKISMLWFGFGLGVGLLLTPARRWLATPWPWLAAGIAFACFGPYLVWEAHYGWPTLEFMHNALVQKMVHKPPLEFVTEQFLVMNPLAAPLWIAGLVRYFRADDAKPVRLLAWIWITVFVLLLTTGAARTSYIGPAYVVLLPMGGVAFERFARAHRATWLSAATAAALVLGGAAVAPLATPLLPPKTVVAYERILPVSVPKDQRASTGPLPLHLAERFGGQAVQRAVAQAWVQLSPEDRARVGILAPSFGNAGAIDFVAAKHGWPTAISGHNNYWLWGPGSTRGDPMLVIAESPSEVTRWYRQVRRLAPIRCHYCLPIEARSSVYLARGPGAPLRVIWPKLKRYF